jgi:hypothetical protein
LAENSGRTVRAQLQKPEENLDSSTG